MPSYYPSLPTKIVLSDAISRETYLGCDCILHWLFLLDFYYAGRNHTHSRPPRRSIRLHHHPRDSSECLADSTPHRWLAFLLL